MSEEEAIHDGVLSSLALFGSTRANLAHRCLKIAIANGGPAIRDAQTLLEWIQAKPSSDIETAFSCFRLAFNNRERQSLGQRLELADSYLAFIKKADGSAPETAAQRRAALPITVGPDITRPDCGDVD